MITKDHKALERAMIISGLALLFACAANRQPLANDPPTVVKDVNLEKYMGKWYEIARYPNRFQKDCLASTAVYSIREDGRIRVLNACRKESLEGPLKRAEGKAWVVDETTKAKLKVQFFWPFRGDYWIIDLGGKYEYAVVGHPKRKYLWILSRTPQMEVEVYEAILERIIRNGYDPDRLVRTKH
jgi:apolipoprotein D and lipocalin family protein